MVFRVSRLLETAICAMMLARVFRSMHSSRHNLRVTLEEHGFAIVNGVLQQEKMDAVMREMKYNFTNRCDLGLQMRLWERSQIGGMMGMTASDLKQPEVGWGSLDYSKLNQQLLQLQQHLGSSVLHDLFNISLPTFPSDAGYAGPQNLVNTPCSIFKIVTDAALLDIVKLALGVDHASGMDVVPIQHFRMAPPVDLSQGVGPAELDSTGWRQDRFSYHPAADPKILACWFPFTDVTPEMGALQVLAGSHKLGFQAHVPEKCSIRPTKVEDLKDHHGLDVVTLDARAGDLIILDPLLIHSSSPNLSPRFTVSLDIRFCPSRSMSAQPWFPSFNVGNVTVEEYAQGWARAEGDQGALTVTPNNCIL